MSKSYRRPDVPVAFPSPEVAGEPRCYDPETGYWRVVNVGSLAFPRLRWQWLEPVTQDELDDRKRAASLEHDLARAQFRGTWLVVAVLGVTSVAAFCLPWLARTLGAAFAEPEASAATSALPLLETVAQWWPPIAFIVAAILVIRHIYAMHVAAGTVRDREDSIVLSTQVVTAAERDAIIGRLGTNGRP